MKSQILAAAASALLTLWQSSPALALDGAPFIHDPSTVVECDGKWYTFGTGGGGLMSDDGWTWRSGAVRPGGGVAPDIMKIGDRYYVTYAVAVVERWAFQHRPHDVEQNARPKLARFRIQ